MPMTRVSRDRALTKHEFHRRLRDWSSTTDDFIIGPEDTDGRAPWIYVRDGSEIYQLHADTKRPAVTRYLQEVDSHGDDLDWETTASEKGKMTAVVYGPTKTRIKSFYLYRAG
jgi:hypothetical protein